MKRSFAKYMGLAFFLAGLAILLFAIPTGNVFLMLFGGVWTAGGFYQFSHMRKLQRKNFDWYRSRHRHAVSERGKVSCYSCGNHSVRVRNLFQRTYTREHFCGDCGTTLFFSQEG